MTDPLIDAFEAFEDAEGVGETLSRQAIEVLVLNAIKALAASDRNDLLTR
jgi:hypothetical protein